MYKWMDTYMLYALCNNSVFVFAIPFVVFDPVSGLHCIWFSSNLRLGEINNRGLRDAESHQRSAPLPIMYVGVLLRFFSCLRFAPLRTPNVLWCHSESFDTSCEITSLTRIHATRQPASVRIEQPGKYTGTATINKKSPKKLRQWSRFEK